MAACRGITWRQEIKRGESPTAWIACCPLPANMPILPPVFKHEVAHSGDLPSTGPALAPFYSCDPVSPAVFHVVRLGDAALVTAPFEIFTDYAIRIQARSKAVLTFVVQLSCQHMAICRRAGRSRVADTVPIGTWPTRMADACSPMRASQESTL